MLYVPKAILGLYSQYSRVVKNTFICNKVAGDAGNDH